MPDPIPETRLAEIEANPNAFDAVTLAREVRRLRAEVGIAKEQAKRRREWFAWCQREIGPMFPGGTHHDENAQAYIERLRRTVNGLSTSARETEAELEKLRAVAVAAWRYRSQTIYCINSEDVSSADEKERDAMGAALDDALRDAGIGGGA